MRRSWVRIPSAPLEARRLSPAGFFVPLAAPALIASALVASPGCGDSPAPAEPTPPPVPVAPATIPDGVSTDDLRRQLGANRNATFVRDDDRIVEAVLVGSGVTDLTPLKGLPLRSLDISGLEVRDLTPLQGMPLEILAAEAATVDDIAPLKGLPVKELYLRDTRVSDLGPLVGAPIERLNVVATPVADISAVRDLPLETLWIASTKVTDLSPLAGKSLVSLDVEDTAVADLAVLADMATLRRLNIARSAVTDLSPLKGLRLERLIFTPATVERGLDAVRGMPSLAHIGETFDAVMPATEFWSRYDAGAFRTSGEAPAEPPPSP